MTFFDKAIQITLSMYAERTVPLLKENILTYYTGNYVPRYEREKDAGTVQFTIQGNELTIFGGKYLYTYAHGRGPTVNDGDGAVRRNVLQYLKEENIQPAGVTRDGKPIDQSLLALFISRGIHQKGTQLFRTKGNSGVFSDVLETGPQSVEEIVKQISDQLSVQLSDNLKQEWQQ